MGASAEALAATSALGGSETRTSHRPERIMKQKSAESPEDANRNGQQRCGSASQGGETIGDQGSRDQGSRDQGKGRAGSVTLSTGRAGSRGQVEVR